MEMNIRCWKHYDYLNEIEVRVEDDILIIEVEPCKLCLLDAKIEALKEAKEELKNE